MTGRGVSGAPRRLPLGISACNFLHTRKVMMLTFFSRFCGSLILLVLVAAGVNGKYSARSSPRPRITSLTFGPCILVVNSTCNMDFVKYYLFTRSNPDYPELVEAAEDRNNLTSSTFNPDHPTKIIIHGYNSDINLDYLVEIKNAYLKSSDLNVFMIEWGVLNPAPCYPTAAVNARYVGSCAANLVRAVAKVTLGNTLRSSIDLKAVSSKNTRRRKTKELPPIPSNLHVVGFSLGAHVASFIANNLRPQRLSRITGLDPALPLFLTPFSDKKLDASDADFVDVVHTNALWQGQLHATGHLDFYMNGGFRQPGCELAEIGPESCNHHRAPSYFAESILTESGFWGWPCDGWFAYILGRCSPQSPTILMGEFADPASRGVYFVDTRSTSPFALGRDYRLHYPQLLRRSKPSSPAPAL